MQRIHKANIPYALHPNVNNGANNLEKNRRNRVESHFGGHVSERVSGGFGCERGRAGQACIDLDDTVLLAVRVQRVLDVALADDAQTANYLPEENHKNTEI